MGYACQIDDEFVPNPVTVSGAISRHMLVDNSFYGAPVSTIPLPTGLEEAPIVNLSSAVFPSAALLNNLAQVLERFRMLKALRPGWDSYGGLPVSSGAIVPALKVTLEALQQCKFPRIHANGQGGIDLVWESPQAELTMTVDAGGQFEILFDEEGTELDETPAPVGIHVARAYLAKFHPVA